MEVHPTFTENVAQLLLPLLARHSQEDFRNKLVIVSLKRVRWIHTKEE